MLLIQEMKNNQIDKKEKKSHLFEEKNVRGKPLALKLQIP